MRVHEFAKQLTAELGKEVKSSQIIDILSGKKEGLKAQSSIDDAMMKFVRESLGGNKPVEAKKEEPKKAGPKKEEGKKEAPKQENKKVQPKPNNNSNSGNQNKKNNNNNNNQNRNNNQGKNNNNNGNNQGRNNNNKQNNNGNNQGKNNNNKPANGNNQNGAKQESRGTNFRNAVSNNRNTRNNNNNNNRFNNNNNRNNNNNKNHQPAPKKQEPVEPVIKTIKLPEVLTVGELASKIKVPVAQLIKKMFMAGKMYNVNSDLPFDEAADIALEYNFIAEEEEKVDVIEELLREEEEDEADMTSRPPVVCVMGHVDHGKTSLLDAIRNSDVTAGEAGGITQHIGASVVSINGQKITFLDTPGHEAFTAMRMRGAQSTDIAILVVAADDGVMPQTVEAINHAKAAGIEIIVAINKIDKESANIDRVKQELMEYELVPEDWGGSTIFCPVSAHTKEGIDNLLEMIILTAEILELKANKNRKARGIVIEAQLDKGRGSVATILVQKGTLHVGDCLAIGDVHGKVRAMFDDKGRKVKEATPSMPVEVLGLNGVPNSGEIVIATENEKEARTISEAFINRGKEKLIADTKQRMSLDDLYNRIQEGNVKDLNLIIKADVQGSVEAVKQSLLKLSNEEVAVKCIHSGVGAINESDVILASASNAIIIGFNIRPDNQAKEVAEREKVDIRLYRVIYNAIEDIESAMKGMLDPIFEEKVIGHAEVRQTYKASGVGTIAGSYVLDGTIQRNCKVRISREGEQIFEGELASLKRFKDDVKEVKTGFECGLVMDGFNDIKEGDIIEAYIMVEVPR
ncbi:translation initiation factor IF-2 [Clostridium sp. AF15-6B]|nr:translation initiation factor IF-2 [Clostridium sp. AF16-25]RGH06111.1 translation initiation factor IF-2 [Clostridium sp. AF15-49]RGH10115.1 translation initiation factor IF-2 [Clostridium sp. AF15-6B]